MGFIRLHSIWKEEDSATDADSDADVDSVMWMDAAPDDDDAIADDENDSFCLKFDTFWHLHVRAHSQPLHKLLCAR